MTLPIDRTKLNTAISNQSQTSIPASGQANREALTVSYNTIDELYNYVLGLVTSGTLSPVPPRNMWQQGIINAGLGVAQRIGDLGSKTLATGTSAYAVDRIKSFNNGSGVNATVSQVAVSDLDGAGYGLQIVHAAAPSTGGKLAHSYTLEARDAYKWAGLPCVKALKVKGVSGMDKVTINARYKTSESAVDSTSTLISSTTLAINNLSWQVIPLTVATLPIRATITNTGVIGFEIVFSKSTSEASGDGGIITELELIKGGIDLGFQPRSYQEELDLCQRYLRVLDGYNHVVFNSTNNFSQQIRFDKPMRIKPTLDTSKLGAYHNANSSPGANEWIYWYSTTSTFITWASVPTAISTDYGTSSYMGLYSNTGTTPSLGTVGADYVIVFGAGSKILLDSEL